MFTSGLWRLRDDVEALTGMRPIRRRWSAEGLQAVCGWGRKPTAAAARAAAERVGIPYIALEDGFVRSRLPGPAERSISYVVDPVGVYYDASAPSALEAMVLARSADPAVADREAAEALEALRRHGLSKYNMFDDEADLAAVAPEGATLVIDQTFDDAAVIGAGAQAGTFMRMLIAAAEENPDAPVLIKTHPETVMGRRAGYLDAATIGAAARASPAFANALASGRVAPLTARLRPRTLFARVGRVYAVSSLLGFEALLAGRPVTCFGQAFYAGWGLTDDRAPPVPRRAPAPLACLAAAAYIDYARYFDPVTRRPCAPLAAFAALARLLDGDDRLRGRR